MEPLRGLEDYSAVVSLIGSPHMAAAARLASTLPDTPAEDPEFQNRLDRLLRLCEARPDQPVGVAGPEALDLMCALARRGFAQVEAALRRTCGCADQACELVIVSGRDADTIAATVEAVGGMLCPGGRLAVVAHRLHGAHERQRLGNLLAHRGYRYRPDALEGPVMIATKPDIDDIG